MVAPIAPASRINRQAFSADASRSNGMEKAWIAAIMRGSRSPRSRPLPIPFDREASTEKACRLIKEAGAMGATIAAFGETWLPGYPFFCHAPTSALTWRAMAEYFANAVEIPGPTTDELCEAAGSAGIDVVIGVAERDTTTKGTVYCTLLFIGREGKILGRHRKIKPTFNERSVWGDGDALGLRVHDRPYGRISGLNCWEHNTMLPGYAWQPKERRSMSRPGRAASRGRAAFADAAMAASITAVAGFRVAGRLLRHRGWRRALAADTPERYRELSTVEYYRRQLHHRSTRRDHRGTGQGETILIAEGSREAVLAAKSLSDIGGHYSRPDLFRLIIDAIAGARVVDSGIAGRATPELGVGHDPEKWVPVFRKDHAQIRR